ncbi:hypothetical protein COLO4_20918 [Corchorus olitorius]|uniref:Uncharacterized protein n=1 Tax=Corchorus olitorius TaxID=93759 RepID=A0A1R3IW75_9ROSI|nr:hypothetical protein COLO4_20918 [Corchorus olitorius]
MEERKSEEVQNPDKEEGRPVNFELTKEVTSVLANS